MTAIPSAIGVETKTPRDSGLPAWQSVWVLIFLTVLWGSSFPVSKYALSTDSVAALTFARFSVAAAVLSPFLRMDRHLWRPGLELSLFAFPAIAAQTIGIDYTTVNHAAFITSMTVIFIPLLSLALGFPVHRIIGGAAILAFIGCGLLSYDGGRLNPGDLGSLACAILYAGYILRLQTVANKHSPLSLAAVQMLIVALLSGIWLAAEKRPAHLSHISSVIYLGVLVTAIPAWLQTVAQRAVSATKAGVIFTLEPVFAAAFGNYFLHEKWNVRSWLGAGLIIAAAVLCQLPGLLRNSDQPKMSECAV